MEPTSRTKDRLGRGITVAWRKVIYRDNDSHTRAQVFAGANPGARGNAGELTFRADEFDEFALVMEVGGAEQLADLDLRSAALGQRLGLE